MGNIYERLDKILPTIKEKEFQEKRGLGNEVGFHIFDYEPKYELLVREYIEDLKEKINKKSSDIYIREFDLYEIIIKIIEDKGYLEKLFKMEKEKGTDKLVKPIKSTLRFTQKNDLIVDYFKKNVKEEDIVFITGVGKVWPAIRAHTILNNLQPVVKVPVVMFFPGKYSGLELHLFNKIKDENYYRAFRLIE
ncbi:DUF1788 domain-containing protein [Anaerosalibacter bizertensis]|uniref:DUF1788 domain-containing protein n=1 Tax=Anaerosalibacter bizertensis TaxID=932217 RepID=A0A9Q4ACT9_9FIRM|nr:DUF1788 domain-containing protein [Anaerosalibacter bizertensis]MBV1819083.1 DUF1788 domain-containing protein [Bacteroidales bacterium MSK.15.36]HHV26670.1 DUF1788 domain-containing protein [Tissierellia bacterium]MCB5559414.1 DUF1788 domain-containing protein [Anaerosalibacter bizertensis]MCG4565362.1 DUF1788 domain-containing protein [Anaerosalibacter bizertensis]MCG4582449.1 DUF1788 domain-containing protein [Anaerosalibacter bizertensis]